MKRAPIWTGVICALAAAVYALPALQPFLVYNRDSVAEGELWRLLTGNLVHFSGEHLAKDLAALLLAGAMIEQRDPRKFALLCVACAALIGIALFAFEPGVLVYGGLSGVAVAACAYLGLQGSAESGIFGRTCQVLLAGLTVKIALEFAGITSTSDGFVLVPASHAVGALTAAGFFALTQHEAVASRV